MKRFFVLVALAALCLAPAGRAQDAAFEERLNRIAGQLEQLENARVKLEKDLGDLRREVSALRDQAGKPTGNFASQEELKKLAEKLQEVDQKRVADNEKVLATLERLAKAGARGDGARVRDSEPKAATGSGASAEKGFEYVIQSGDTLSAIAQAYREKGVKVYPEQILKANPGLKATNLQVGKKIFVPAP
jgi:predicted RNase H-like nuclease (RuvC/YqgF family)